MIGANFVGGVSVALSVLGVLAIANVLTSYVLPGGATLTGYIESRTGLDTQA
jgi:hypothetical protein